jgi:hypothetical protein
MRGLELDGIHDDGEHIVLRDDDGQTYTVLIDEALRAAVRRDRPALGMLQSRDTTPLRPREIQAMLRGGRSAEEIAEIAAIDVEHVRRFEGPVLAEREYLARQARSYRMGRGDGRVLGEVVSERLAARHALDDTRWDAWRREDGTWTLELSFRAGGRERDAHWVVDVTRRSAEADDDEARWLTLDDDGEAPMPTRGRLTALRSAVYDQEADDDSGSGRPHTSRWGREPRDGAGAIDEDSLEALNSRRGLRPVSEDTWSTLDDEPDGRDQDGDRHDPVAPASPVVPLGASSRGGTTGASAPSPADEDLFPHVPGSTEQDTASARLQHPAGGVNAAEYSDTVDLTPLPGFGSEESPSVRSSPHEQEPRPAGGDVPHDGQDAEDAEDVSPAGQKATTPSGSAPTSAGSGTKPKGKGKGKSSAKRQSMPSWDEIVFGPKHE